MPNYLLWPAKMKGKATTHTNFMALKGKYVIPLFFSYLAGFSLHSEIYKNVLDCSYP